MQPIYLVCGVPGSGKSWICEQLVHWYKYVPNDAYINGDYAKGLIHEAKHSEKKILADCPFAERALIKELRDRKLDVKVLFIIEDPLIVQKRYQTQRNKPIPPQHITRMINLRQKPPELADFCGSSNDILEHLRVLR